MGFFNNFSKSNKEKEPSPYFVVMGFPVKCSHCGSNEFYEREAQLNTAGMTFLNLDWANDSARVLVCKSCGKLEWFQ